MSTLGLIGLVLAFAGTVVSLVCLGCGHVLARAGRSNAAATARWSGCVGSIVSAVALTLCCGILVYCFLVEDLSIEYVLLEHSDATGVLGTLFRISGLWAGQEGSLLLWAWLISLFSASVSVRAMRTESALDAAALFVMQAVLAAFVGLLLFSEDNMPFIATAEPYIDSDGHLTEMASALGMNPLLEHWAQAVHPPTLFIGYAGLTVPFAYALAALAVGDASRTWVDRCNRYAVVSWLFLGIGIGLGSVWAYVVLGWGGYWGWDPVENASLLSWMIALALVHSLTVYRQHGAFKRWSIMCACLAFAFAITGTFITRSGIVDSVHAFAGDSISLFLFGGLIIVSIAAGIVGLALRWKSFGTGDAVQALTSRDAAYYFNNVVMVVLTFSLCYLTVASALPSFLPLGGRSISAGTYNALARPFGIFYCLIMAVCPLLSWGKTDRKRFLKQAKLPAACAIVLFIVLMVYFATTLYPSYAAIMQAGGTEAAELASEGPSWYYNGLAIVGFAVASLLFFNTLFMIARACSACAKAKGVHPVSGFFELVATNSARVGGYLAHFGVSVILIGLIGSSMYVTEQTGYLPLDQDTGQAADTFVIGDYELRLSDSDIREEDDHDFVFQVDFDVYDAESGAYRGHVAPQVEFAMATQQSKLNASVLRTPTEDLFVVYRGASEDGALSLDVRINPLISFVWAGFALLIVGTAIAAFGKRGQAVKPDEKAV